MELILCFVVTSSAILLRACRPGPVPRWHRTWFDIPR